MKRMALFPPQPSKQNDNANTGVFNLPPQPRAVRPNNTMVSNTIANQIVDSINQPVSAGVSNEDIKRAQQIADILRSRFAQTLVGQDSLRESLILTLAAGGHILIESVPGLAKTTAAQTLATAMSGSFKKSAMHS